MTATSWPPPRRSPIGFPRTSPTPMRSGPTATTSPSRPTSSTGGPGFPSERVGTVASEPRSRRCRSKRSSRFCCASTSSRWRSRPTAITTTTPRWWCSWPGPPKRATAVVTEADHGLPRRSGLGFVSGPRHVRTGGTRLLSGAQTRQSRDPRRRAARGGPRRGRAGRRNVPNASTIHQRERRLTMASHSREQLEAWVDRWLQANKDCEKACDWRPLGDFYAADATYGWNIGPKEDVMCVGVDEIRDVAMGLEMEGLENWVYEYQKVLIDDKQGEIVGFWKQIVNKTDGSQDEIYGIGGSWFRLNDRGLIEWQRDFFDFGHVAKMFGSLIESGDLSTGMQKRIKRSVAGEKLPGYYPLGQAPVPIW